MSKESSSKTTDHAKSHKSSESSKDTLAEVLEKYALALRSKPETLSVHAHIPELQIKSALENLFPDLKFGGRRDWHCVKPLSIRRAFRACFVSKGSDSGVKLFELLRAIILPCYCTAESAWMDARLLAAGEDLGEEFQGFALTKEQIKLVDAELPDLQRAMHGVIFMADMWPMDFEDAYARDHYGSCLKTVARAFRDRDTNKIKSLDVALGFSGSGQGKSSDVKKRNIMNSWNDNCFDIHLLHLSGWSITKACTRYVAGKGIGTKSGSSESLRKEYGGWRKEPVTAVRLHLGDPLATRILSLPDVQELINERFPPVQH